VSDKTTNLGLTKPNATTDTNTAFNLDTFLNGNWDKIDEVIGLLTSLKTNAQDSLVNAINENTASLSGKMELYIGDTLPDIVDRKENTLYFKVTDTISSGTTDTVKVSPTMGIKIV
jgi:hypothetical protein